jgi:hypothetical protein
MGSTIIFHWFAQAISVMRAVQSLLDPHGQDHLLHARVAAVAHVPWVKKRGCSLSIILLRELHKLHNTKVVTNKSTIPQFTLASLLLACDFTSLIINRHLFLITAAFHYVYRRAFCFPVLHPSKFRLFMHESASDVLIMNQKCGDAEATHRI